MPADTRGIDALLERHAVNSVVEYGAQRGGPVARGPVYHAATFDTPVHADAALLLHGLDPDFELRLECAFSSAERLVAVWEPADGVANRVTDWVEINHIDFTRIEQIEAADGDLHVFGRRCARRHDLPGHLVLSVTSYAARFPTLARTLRRILRQTIRADAVVLWIAPGDAAALPPDVLELRHQGLTIRLAEDVKSYKKIVPALIAYPDSFIVTLDDDQIYPADLLQPLVDDYRSPKEILCRRAHQLLYGPDGRPRPYLQWRMEVPAGTTGPDVFPTCGAGALYPPLSLAPQTVDRELFGRLAPHADDVWLYWMARMAGSTARVVGQTWQNMVWPGSQSTSLMQHNWNGGNDRQIAALFDHFGRPGVAPARPQSAPAARPPATFDSAGYWQRRYASGGNSGAGSYGRLAQFKAEILNDFVSRNGIGSVIEFGSGDGAQLALATYPRYLGFDVAPVCLDQCRQRFAGDGSKSFRHTDEYGGETAALTLSLDVIYHLIEDGVFQDYMARLFDASERFVIVYASNEDRAGTATHVKHRRFTDWVAGNRPAFRLVRHIPNRYPLTGDEQNESFADFFVFERLPGRPATA